MDEKLKAKIIVQCFLHQVGFVPDNVVTLNNGESCVTGNGYGLAWSWPNVRIIDDAVHQTWQDKLNDALEYFREERQRKKEDEKSRRTGITRLSE